MHSKAIVSQHRPLKSIFPRWSLGASLLVAASLFGLSPVGAAPIAIQVVTFKPSVTQVNGAGGSVTFASEVTGPRLNATCTISSSPAVRGLPVSTNCYGSSWVATLPANPGATPITYTFTLTAVSATSPKTTAKATTQVTLLVRAVPTPSGITGVKSVVGNGGGSGYCALLTSGGVNCWGYGEYGQLGNGLSSSSKIPVAVKSTSGTGLLTDVASLVGNGSGYCALLTAGGVDCWGNGEVGELGNGSNLSSNIPVAVKSTSRTGLLTDVASLTSGYAGYCALLIEGMVTCWGNGEGGELGNGSNLSSNIPVAVKSTSRAGLLTGVVSLTSNGTGYCALLTSGEVNCWGSGSNGRLGNGSDSRSNIPVSVKSTSGPLPLTGVASLTSGYAGYCALLTSGKVNCWGYGGGKLGNGSNSSSNIPVAVKSTSGTDFLTRVASLTSTGSSYCALLKTGEVNCWGSGEGGELGNGSNSISNIPVAVKSTLGTGLLTSVASLMGNGSGYCARLTSGGVNCWGSGGSGQLGNGSNSSSNIPVAVKSTSGTDLLTGVASLTSTGSGYCALLTSGRVNCWGYGINGYLGNGSDSNSNIPVAVKSIL